MRVRFTLVFHFSVLERTWFIGSTPKMEILILISSLSLPAFLLPVWALEGLPRR